MIINIITGIELTPLHYIQHMNMSLIKYVRAGGVKSQFEASRTDAVVRRRSNDRVNENINIYVQEK